VWATGLQPVWVGALEPYIGMTRLRPFAPARPVLADQGREQRGPLGRVHRVEHGAKYGQHGGAVPVRAALEGCCQRVGRPL